MAKRAHNVQLTLGEIFQKLEAAASKAERAAILKENDHPALQAILRLNFDPRIKFELPEGTPKNYRASRNPIGFGAIHLKGVFKKFYIFVKTSTPGLRQLKREDLFVQTLEQLDSLEAQILIDAKDKKLGFGLTKKLVDEVFPGLLPEDVVVNESSSVEVVSDTPEALTIATSPDSVVEVKEAQEPKVKKTRTKKEKKDEAQSTSEGV